MLLSAEWDLTDGRNTTMEDNKNSNESLFLSCCDSNRQEKQLYKHDDNPIKDVYPVREKGVFSDRNADSWGWNVKN